MAINRANGGVVGVNNKTSGGGNVVSTFENSGTFKVQDRTTEVDVLVVAGGGGGGAQGGGGGAGGMQNKTGQPVIPGSSIAVTVGAGGVGGYFGGPVPASDITPTSGADSVFANPANPITSTGGGRGGGRLSGGGHAASDGGSGGGGASAGAAPGGTDKGDGTSGQGNDGGQGIGGDNVGGAGGGGAGAAGTAVPPGNGDGGNTTNQANFGQPGGIGLQSTITGTSKYYAGGGGGSGGTGNTTSFYSGGKAGQGGGGTGKNGGETPGIALAGGSNTGGGGGASTQPGNKASNAAKSEAGGSGIVIVKEKDKANGMFNMNSHFNSTVKGQWPTADKYQIGNSGMFSSGSSQQLVNTPSPTGNTQTYTISAWIKKTMVGTNNGQDCYLFSSQVDSNNRTVMGVFGSSATQGIFFENKVSGTSSYVDSAATFRDPMAWMHCVWAIDTTQSTSTERVKLYVNGKQITAFDSTSYPNQDISTQWNRAQVNYMGSRAGGNYYDGYLADVHLIDGQQLSANYFGEPDPDNPNTWIPKKYNGTFGAQGSLHEFGNTGTGSGANKFASDTSGNANHWDTNNFAGSYQMTDSPTNNFCTYNPLDAASNQGSGSTYSKGNLNTNTGDNKNDIGTMGFQNGKWYWEVTCAGSGIIGVQHESVNHLNDTNLNDNVGSVALSSYHGTIFHNNNQDTTPGTDTDGCILGCAVDMDNNKIYWHKDGTYYDTSGGTQNPVTGANPITVATGTNTTGFWFPKLAAGTGSQTFESNFGNPSTTISSGNSDDNGYGNFEYDVPAGYYAICTKNLAQYG